MPISNTGGSLAPAGDAGGSLASADDAPMPDGRNMNVQIWHSLMPEQQPDSDGDDLDVAVQSGEKVRGTTLFDFDEVNADDRELEEDDYRGPLLANPPRPNSIGMRDAVVEVVVEALGNIKHRSHPMV